MSYYENNLSCLKEYRNDMYSYLVKHENEYNEDEFIKTLTAKDGSSVLEMQKDSQIYRLGSIYSPSYEADAWARRYTYNNIDIIASIFGFGAGYYVRAMYQAANEKIRIFVYEPSKEIFLYVLHHFDLQDLLSCQNILLCVCGINEEVFLDLLGRVIHWSNIRSQIISLHPLYDELFMEQHRDFLTIINENNSRTLVNRNTEAYFGRDIIENTLRNFRFVKNSNTISEMIDGIPNDIPAIIVSAGPSLDKNIEELKKAKGKAFIVATDTAMKILYQHNIVPDVFVMIDALKPLSYLSDERFMQVPCICKIESNWKILAHHNVRKIFCNSNPYYEALYQKLFKKSVSKYTTGGSVATAAFSVCVELGFQNIILIGQDLAYAGDKTHAGDVGEKGKILGEENGIRYVEGIDGGQVKTRHDWYIYLEWFQSSVEAVKEFCQVFDCTEGGAKIRGTTIMTLKDAISALCKKEVDVAECINKLPLSLTKEETQKVYQALLHSQVELNEIYSAANKAQMICREAVALLQKENQITEEVEKKTKQLERYNKKIENNITYLLIDTYISDLAVYTLDHLYEITDDKVLDSIRTFQKARRFYASVKNAAHAIKPLMEQTCKDFYSNEVGIHPHEPAFVIILQADSNQMTQAHASVLKENLRTLLKVQGAKSLVVATTVKEKDDWIEEVAEKEKVPVFRGSEENVVGRFYNAAKENHAEVIVRLIADYSDINPHKIDDAIEFFKENSYDYISNFKKEPMKYGLPETTEIEVFTVDSLRDAYQLANESYQREYVTPYIYAKKRVGYISE